MTEEKIHVSFWKRLLWVPGIILLIPWIIIVLLGFLVKALFISLAVRFVYLVRGRYIVFVHSNSPVWQDYISTHILPRLPSDTVIMNWSDRSNWKWLSLPVRVFRHYGADSEFNPLGMVGAPLRGMRTFRFWQPFRDFKHGNEAPLKELEAEFFEYVETTKPKMH